VCVALLRGQKERGMSCHELSVDVVGGIDHQQHRKPPLAPADLLLCQGSQGLVLIPIGHTHYILFVL